MASSSKIQWIFSRDSFERCRLRWPVHRASQLMNFLNMLKIEKSTGIEVAKAILRAFWPQHIADRDLIYSQQHQFLDKLVALPSGVNLKLFLRFKWRPYLHRNELIVRCINKTDACLVESTIYAPSVQKIQNVTSCQFRLKLNIRKKGGRSVNGKAIWNEEHNTGGGMQYILRFILGLVPLRWKIPKYGILIQRDAFPYMSGVPGNLERIKVIQNLSNICIRPSQKRSIPWNKDYFSQEMGSIYKNDRLIHSFSLRDTSSCILQCFLCSEKQKGFPFIPTK